MVVLCSSLFGEMIQFDEQMFQMAWNHQLISLMVASEDHLLHWRLQAIFTYISLIFFVENVGKCS